MSKKSKRYRQAAESFNSEEKFDLTSAVKTLKETPNAKFDETVELTFRLGVDPRQNDHMVRGTVKLPNGSGKSVRVIVFTENAEEAMNAGAQEAGMDELIKKVEGGWMDFDVAIATTSAMKEVRKVARVLGPRGLMPNPKSGTVSDDVPTAIKEVMGGRVEFKMDKNANVAVVVGKKGFESDQIEQNIKTAYEAVVAAKPESFSGNFIKSATISATMSPGVKLNPKLVG